MEELRFLTAAANKGDSRLGNHNNNMVGFLFRYGRVETQDNMSVAYESNHYGVVA